MQTKPESENDRVTKRGRQKLPRLAVGIDEFAAALGVSGSFIRLEIQRTKAGRRERRLETFRMGRRVLISQASADAYLAGSR